MCYRASARVQRHWSYWQACTVLAATLCIRQKRPIIWQKRPTNTYTGMHRPHGSVLHCVFRQHHMHMSHQHMWTMCVTAAYGNALQCVCRCLRARGAATGAHGRRGNRKGEEERGRDGETMVQRTALAHMAHAHTHTLTLKFRKLTHMHTHTNTRNSHTLTRSHSHTLKRPCTRTHVRMAQARRQRERGAARQTNAK